MDAEYFWIECAGCRLTWKMSLLECECHHPLVCPFCGNQHFSPKAVAAVDVEESVNEEQTRAAKGRRASEDTQFSWF